MLDTGLTCFLHLASPPLQFLENIFVVVILLLLIAKKDGICIERKSQITSTKFDAWCLEFLLSYTNTNFI